MLCGLLCFERGAGFTQSGEISSRNANSLTHGAQPAQQRTVQLTKPRAIAPMLQQQQTHPPLLQQQHQLQPTVPQQMQRQQQRQHSCSKGCHNQQGTRGPGKMRRGPVRISWSRRMRTPCRGSFRWTILSSLCLLCWGLWCLPLPSSLVGVNRELRVRVRVREDGLRQYIVHAACVCSAASARTRLLGKP